MHMIPIYCLSLSHIPPHTPTHTDTMLNVKNMFIIKMIGLNENIQNIPCQK